MVAYNFKSQFAPLVEAGTKRQTIRARGKRRHAAKGEWLQLYTGMRSPACRKLRPDPICEGSHAIAITAERTVFVGVGSGLHQLDSEEIFHLAIADGFGSVDDFFAFFKTKDGTPFLGVLIKW